MNPETQHNPLKVNPDRMIQILSEKVSRTETENAALKTQVEQLVAYINELNKPTEETVTEDK